MRIGKDLRSFILLFAALFIISGCMRAGSGSPEDGYFVRNVIDGDTIELANGRSVRYIGIDAPETTKRMAGGWEFDPEAFAVSAKDLNRELVFRTRVKLEFDVVKEDKYGRWLAYVYTEKGYMVNEELLKEGRAMTYTYPPNVKYTQKFIDAQKNARDNKAGLWKDLKLIYPEQAKDNIGEFRTVRGKVTEVHVSDNKIYINFGKFPNQVLTGVIYRSNVPLFTEQGIDPARSFEGETVEITGKIRDRNGAQIVIDNPSQIEVS